MVEPRLTSGAYRHGHPVLSRLPEEFWTVPYAGDRFPGSRAAAERPGLDAGANCQLYAYAVLEHYGLSPPALRSSELWADTDSTVRVAVPRPLDLVLLNTTGDPWGAHVGVWVGDDEVLHLCAEVGRPALWHMSEFTARIRYRTLVGLKRVLRPTAHGIAASATPSAAQARR